MRKVFWQMMVSLDGFMEGPNHELDWHVVDKVRDAHLDEWIDEDFSRYVERMLGSIDAILLGRVTYQLFADYWPSAKDPEAKAMNELPKIVFSRTLTKVEWQNSRLVKDNAAEEITRLKLQPGKDLGIFGSADLASTLMQLGLIDEIRTFVNPLVLGAGNPMFKNIESRMNLKLLKTETLSSGVVVLYHQPGR